MMARATDESGEIARLREALDALIADLAYFAQILHQAYHGDEAGTWRDCGRGVCPGARRALTRAQEATDAK